MPHEDHPVNFIGKSDEKIAERIADIYDNVAKRGGKIVAGHNIKFREDGDVSYEATRPGLVLVAEVPEIPPEPKKDEPAETEDGPLFGIFPGDDDYGIFPAGR